jgi:hypothetical protein
MHVPILNTKETIKELKEKIAERSEQNDDGFTDEIDLLE